MIYLATNLRSMPAELQLDGLHASANLSLLQSVSGLVVCSSHESIQSSQPADLPSCLKNRAFDKIGLKKAVWYPSLEIICYRRSSNKVNLESGQNDWH
jgi:hypothetical protein